MFGRWIAACLASAALTAQSAGAQTVEPFYKGKASPLLGGNSNVRFDPRKFTWLGSSSNFSNDAYVLIVRKDARVSSVEDALRPGGPPLILGGTADGGGSRDVPK